MATSADETVYPNRRGQFNEENISLLNDFCIFVSKSNMQLLDLIDDKIHCRTIEKANNIEEYVRYEKHMNHLHHSIFGSLQKPPHPLNRSFSDTIQYFQNTQPKKRLFCRYNNYYIVKKYFTEGVQYVKPGETHVYKAIARPLDIYISYCLDLEPMTIRGEYSGMTTAPPERIPHGETKVIHERTYYVLIAPCHAYFKKMVCNAAAMSAFANKSGFEAIEDRSGSTSSEQRYQTEPLPMSNRSLLDQSSGSMDTEHSSPMNSMELAGENDIEIGNTSSNRDSRYFECNIPAKRIKPSHFSNSPIFAIRRDTNIESYCLRSDSTFRILQNGIITGAFSIENEDMDPYVIKYDIRVCDKQFIRETATFKNGSTFQTVLAVQRELLDELRDTPIRKEKIVVNYFFERAFKTIEATYKRFSEMRNVKMIGSCVPAIVPMSDTVFRGAVPDGYEIKP